MIEITVYFLAKPKFPINLLIHWVKVNQRQVKAESVPSVTDLDVEASAQVVLSFFQPLY